MKARDYWRNLILIFLFSFLPVNQLFAATDNGSGDGSVYPCMENSFYWQYKGKPDLPVEASEQFMLHSLNDESYAKRESETIKDALDYYDGSAFQVNVPVLHIKGNEYKDVETAFRIAVGDIFSNVSTRKSGLLKEERMCLMAGIEYDELWTRDFSINLWNGVGLFMPSVSVNSLMAVLNTDKENIKITGQYWDKIIWTIGAWEYYLVTGDLQFLETAYEAVENTLTELEHQEFDSELGLFRGPAVYGDGIGAFPARYTQTGKYGIDGNNKWLTTIDKWADANPELRVSQGGGMPMHSLSTNAVYYQSYRIMAEMSKELGLANDNLWEQKGAELLKDINEHFWSDSLGMYKYLVDPYGDDYRQEGLGISYALLFGIASDNQKYSIFENVYVADSGLPCLHPSYERYRDKEKGHYGRHSGTVWPFIMGFWAEACASLGQYNLFMHDFLRLTASAKKEMQFVEILHPDSLVAYGGLQEDPFDLSKPMFVWGSTNRQTWSATAFFRMVIRGLIGMDISRDGIRFSPYLPANMNGLTLRNIKYRSANLTIHMEGEGDEIQSFLIDGISSQKFIPNSVKGDVEIQIFVE